MDDRFAGVPDNCLPGWKIGAVKITGPNGSHLRPGFVSEFFGIEWVYIGPVEPMTGDLGWNVTDLQSGLSVFCAFCSLHEVMAYCDGLTPHFDRAAGAWNLKGLGAAVMNLCAVADVERGRTADVRTWFVELRATRESLQ